METELKKKREYPKARYVRISNEDFVVIQEYAARHGSTFAGYAGMLIRREIARIRRLKVDNIEVK